MKIGYTCGVYDLFHVGHLNILKAAKSMCDHLIVGITVDELVSYKGKKTVIPYEDRAKIVEAIRYVDTVVPQTSVDKVEACRRLKYDVLFVGDDWYGHDSWKSYEAALGEMGVKVVYFPYTSHVSTSSLKDILKEHKDV